MRDWRLEEGQEEDETPEKNAQFIADTILAAVKRQSQQPPVAIFMDNAPQPPVATPCTRLA